MKIKSYGVGVQDTKAHVDYEEVVLGDAKPAPILQQLRELNR